MSVPDPDALSNEPVPAWFDAETYAANKLNRLRAEEPDGNWTPETMAAAFDAAGYGNDAAGLYRHFLDFGNAENVSPSPWFDVDEYLAAKLVQARAAAPEAYGDKTVADITLAFKEAGFSAWDHYTLYGQLEGVSPSFLFDTNAYLNAKLAQLQADNPAVYGDWTAADVVGAFRDAGLNPIKHYELFGRDEGLSYAPGTPGEPVIPDEPVTPDEPDDPDGPSGGVWNGTDEDDDFTVSAEFLVGVDGQRITTINGLAGDDTFSVSDQDGPISALSINGGKGDDTLTASVADSALALHVRAVEDIAIKRASGASGAVALTIDGASEVKSLSGLQSGDSLTIDAANENVSLSGLDAGVAFTVAAVRDLTIDGLNVAEGERLTVDASAASGAVSIDGTGARGDLTLIGGAGDDVFTLNGGSTASIDGGAGEDTLTASVADNDLALHVRAVEDIAIKRASGASGAVDLAIDGAGEDVRLSGLDKNDSIRVTGKIGELTLTDKGTAHITVESGASVGSINCGSGSGSITVESDGSVGSINGSDNNDTITVNADTTTVDGINISGSGRIGSINGGKGDDTLTASVADSALALHVRAVEDIAIKRASGASGAVALTITARPR